MMTDRSLFNLLVFFLIVTGGSAQEILFVETTNVQRALDEYKSRYVENGEIQGYRIQYLFTTDRREMENVEQRFKRFYNYIPHMWEHDQPYYRLYAGSFVDRSKAMKLLVEIRTQFPEALLVNSTVKVADVIDCRDKIME